LEILNDPVYNTLHRGTPPDGLCDTVQSNLTTRGCSLFISPTKILHYALLRGFSAGGFCDKMLYYE
ncbi:MAG: hypothetical protein IJL47_04980, partial [Lachnospiraceae bacterium]|nr:hypothetical protein [Lachnospiraceae bacterium]